MANTGYTEWEIDFFKRHFPDWQPGLTDGVRFLHSQEEARTMERGWARFAAWVRDNEQQYPGGFHHMGMHWADIYYLMPKDRYKPGILRVAHRKLGPKNIHCLREERLPNGRVRWVLSYHWEDRCPACEKTTLSLGKRPEPAKLLLRSNRTADIPDNEDNGRPRLLLRKK